MTSCPQTAAMRLTHPECVPVSRATRAGACAPKYSCSAARVVRRRAWLTKAPSPSSTHSSLKRSPKSIPMERVVASVLRVFGFVLCLVMRVGLLSLHLECVTDTSFRSPSLGTGLLIPATRSMPLCSRSRNADPRCNARNAAKPRIANTARFRKRRAEGQRRRGASGR